MRAFRVDASQTWLIEHWTSSGRVNPVAKEHRYAYGPGTASPLPLAEMIQLIDVLRACGTGDDAFVRALRKGMYGWIRVPAAPYQVGVSLPSRWDEVRLWRCWWQLTLDGDDRPVHRSKMVEFHGSPRVHGSPD